VGGVCAEGELKLQPHGVIVADLLAAMLRGMQTPDRLERLAALLRECPVSDRTEAVIDALVMLIEQTHRTSPSDAADFADMLLRMYVRWAEKHKYPATVLDVSYAEEAGIKSAILQVDSPFAFGTLSVEAGTHRLVRMSHFNSAGKRHTSFAAVEPGDSTLP
jgi:peptide chain release factor 2